MSDVASLPTAVIPHRSFEVVATSKFRSPGRPSVPLGFELPRLRPIPTMRSPPFDHEAARKVWRGLYSLRPRPFIASRSY